MEIEKDLEVLGQEIKSFTQNQEKKLKDQEKRLNNLESKYEVLDQRPFLAQGSTQEDREYKANLRSYLAKGKTEATDVASYGFPLRYQTVKVINKFLSDSSTIRRIASVDKISGDHVTYVKNSKSIGAQWVQKGKRVTQDPRNVDNIYSFDLKTHELCTQPSATQRMLEDSSLDVENWIIEQAAIAFRVAEEQAFISGDGASEPMGIMEYNQNTLKGGIKSIKTIDAGKLAADDIINLYYDLDINFSANGTFLANKYIIRQIRQMKYQQNGQYIWQPGIKEGEPETLFGLPIISSPYMNMPSSSGDIVLTFGDFKQGYKIVDRTDMRILRDPYSYKPYVSFYITKRLGADVVHPDAFRYLKFK